MAELNPEIILAGKNPTYEPVAAAGLRQQTLRGALMQNNQAAIVNPQIQQENQQKIDAGAMANQQAQIGLQDQQIYSDVMKRRAAATAAPGAMPQDPWAANAAIINDLATAGMSGNGLNGIIQQHLKQAETQSIANKNNQEASHFGVESQKLKTEAVSNAAQSVLQLPSDQRPAAYARARAALIQGGYASPGDIEPNYPGDDVLQQHANNAVEVSKQLENQRAANEEQRKAAIAGPLLDAATTKAAQDKLVLAGQMNPNDKQAQVLAMTPEQRTTAAHNDATLAETSKNNAVLRSQGAQRVAIEGGRLGLERERLGFDQAGGVSPAAQMAVDGRMDPQTLRRMLRSQPGLLGQIQKVDPQFDEANVESRYNTLKEFTNTSIGKAGGQALALNTLIHHADLYMQAADALKNGTFRPGNAAYNAVANAFGSAPPTNAALIGRFFAAETGKVASGGVPAEGEINGILKNLGTDASPEQIAGAGRTLLQIAGGRATPLMERVHGAKLDNVVQVLGPDAQQILQKRGFNSNTMKPAAAAGGISVTDPKGGVHTFLKQSAADSFKKAAGIQ